jgi:hypothetical protein
MHNYFLSLGALLCLAGTACGQSVRYGLKAGVSLAQFTGIQSVANQNRVGATAGLMADAPLSEKLALHPELLFSQKGMQFDGSGPGGYRSTDAFRLNYLDLPVLLRLKFGGFFAEAGPQPGLLLNARFTHTESASTSPPLTYSQDNTSATRRFDLGYVLGIGYQLKQRWELGARYNGGILSVSPQSSGSNSPRNSVFQFQAGYLFGGR